MENAAPAGSSETYPIDYDEKAGPRHNAELRGAGTLVLEPAAGRLVFHGKQRRMLGRPVEIAVDLQQVANVIVAGPAVQFEILTGGKRRPFLFFAASAEAAREIAGRLPARYDEEFVAERTFAEKLNRVPAATGFLDSPTHVIIAVNLIVFVAMGWLGAGWFETADMRLYVRYGANQGAATTNGEWWRLVTSMFLHYGLLHVLFNMWALYQSGALVEKLLGRAGFLLAYFASGIAGSLATILWNGDKVWSAGASGAVFGVYGMLGGYILRERRAVPRSVFQPLLKSTLWFAGYNLIFGLAHPGIDNAAHIGGLVTGVGLGACLALPVDRERRAQVAGRRFLGGAAVAAVLIASGVAAAPRFNYVVTEELAWEEMIHDPLARETEMLKEQTATLEAYRATGDAAPVRRWIEETGIPFYTDWARAMGALTLTAGKETAHRRDVLLNLVETKIANYRRLADDAEAGRTDALERFHRAEAEMIATARAAQANDSAAR